MGLQKNKTTTTRNIVVYHFPQKKTKRRRPETSMCDPFLQKKTKRRQPETSMWHHFLQKKQSDDNQKHRCCIIFSKKYKATTTRNIDAASFSPKNTKQRQPETSMLHHFP